MSITSKVKHHDESEAICFQESCEEVVQPVNLEYDILSVEYEFFSYGFDINESFDEGFCVEYESFSFDLIIVALPFKSHKSEFIESENIATKNFDLDQTLTRIGLKGLVDFGPTILPRLLIHDGTISRQMTYMLACYEYAYLFSNWT